jgi:hypothetical protein
VGVDRTVGVGGGSEVGVNSDRGVCDEASNAENANGVDVAFTTSSMGADSVGTDSIGSTGEYLPSVMIAPAVPQSPGLPSPPPQVQGWHVPSAIPWTTDLYQEATGEG